MATKSDAIVVGGGISGLTASYVLAKKNKRVSLIEPNQLGGVLQSKSVQGVHLELGANVLLEKPELSALIDELGMRSAVVYPHTDKYIQYVAVNGVPVAVPKSARQFLASPLFSIAEKLRIVRAVIGRGQFQTNQAEETVLDFFSRGVGEAVVRRVFDPVLKGIYGGKVEMLSAQALFPQLYKALSAGSSIAGYLRQRRRSGIKRPRIFVLRNGMSSLAEALVAGSSSNLTHYQKSAAEISLGNKQFSVRDTEGVLYEAPQLIIAVNGRSAAPMLAGHEIRTLLQHRQYAPISMVHCAVSRLPAKFSVDSFGILYPEGTAHGFLGAMFNTYLFPHLAQPNQQLVTLCFGGYGAQGELLLPPDRVIVEVCRAQLDLEAPEILAKHCWEYAIPQYVPGQMSFVAAVEAFEREFPGLTMAMVDRGGVGVPDRIKSVMELLAHER